jgi:hypothetical protein
MFNNKSLRLTTKLSAAIHPDPALGDGAGILAVEAKKALLEILDDCFEGYAIFPGSQGKRDLFNWWLLEVVPATWCLHYPKTLYTINGLQNLTPPSRENYLLSLLKLDRKQLYQA